MYGVGSNGRCLESWADATMYNYERTCESLLKFSSVWRYVYRRRCR